MSDDARRLLAAALQERYGSAVAVPGDTEGLVALSALATRGVCRNFDPRPVPVELLRLLAAVALAAPSKSDLQQRDIILITDPHQRAALNAVIGEAWVERAGGFAVLCGNNRRQRQLHRWRTHPFANDHLDAFFNASVDAGIALQAMLTAADAAGLGACPISAIRNKVDEVSRLLALPDHVFPVAGLAVGWPARRSAITMRLPLAATVHENRFSEAGIKQAVDDYDTARESRRPFAAQRDPERFGTVNSYGWSEDKARQYAVPERADFGAHIRRKGFLLD